MDFGFVVGAVTLVAAWATNQIGFDDWDEVESAVVVAMIASHVGVAFVPLVRDAVIGAPVFALPLVVVNAAGYYLIGYY